MVTEKLDGGNTMIHQGEVYARSVSEPSRDKWMAMVRKHHAWKVQEPDIHLYGEDIYAIHSIEYNPVPEDRTFYAFAIRRGDQFASFAEVDPTLSNAGSRSFPCFTEAASSHRPPLGRSSTTPTPSPLA